MSGIDYQNERDLHILKYFSSFVSISKGRVIYISDPKISFCPLASHFYKELKNNKISKQEIKEAIKNIIETKIKEYGFFTSNRKFDITGIQVPYGASEMLMFALRRKIIDAAVVVCDGAGTVISQWPELVQGIGARMHNIIKTSPIKETISQLKALKCNVLSDDAIIDQFKGVCKAAELGYKNIGVTVNGQSVEGLKRIRDIEKHYSIKVISLVICTTDIKNEDVEKIISYSDLVWSCLSSSIRNRVGPIAKLQLSELMPVFVTSNNGIDFVSAYCQDYDYFVNNINRNRRYLISSNHKQGSRVLMGNSVAYIEEIKLPVLSSKVSLYYESLEGLSNIKN